MLEKHPFLIIGGILAVAIVGFIVYQSTTTTTTISTAAANPSTNQLISQGETLAGQLLTTINNEINSSSHTTSQTPAAQ